MTCKNLVGCCGAAASAAPTIGTNPSIGLETVALRDFGLIKMKSAMTSLRRAKNCKVEDFYIVIKWLVDILSESKYHMRKNVSDIKSKRCCQMTPPTSKSERKLLVSFSLSLYSGVKLISLGFIRLSVSLYLHFSFWLLRRCTTPIAAYASGQRKERNKGLWPQMLISDPEN